MMRALIGIYLICFCVISSVRSLEEGSACVNFDGSMGVCVIDRNCKWAIDKLRSREIRWTDFIRCGMTSTNSIICCKDESIIKDTTTKAPPINCPRLQTNFFFSAEDITNCVESTEPYTTTLPTSTTPRNYRKCEQACEHIKKIKDSGYSFHIINGRRADVGEFPHMAAIGYADEVDENIITYDCGGSLISQNFVLTAAHCANQRHRQPKTVKLGRVSLVEDEKDQNEAQDIPVKKVHLHRNYTSRRKYNDIALIELQRNVIFEGSVKPACLYTSNEQFDSSQYLEVTGWGRINSATAERSKWLLKAELSEVPLHVCREIYKRISLTQLPENLKLSQICATLSKDGNIVDTCRGDSGGPLQLKLKEELGNVFFIVGITSFGACGSEVPGVYTRVAEYLDWIEEKVWPTTVDILELSVDLNN